MSDTAHAIYAEAALGSTVSYTDGTPRPPERFRRKLRAWEQRNGRGRLIARHAAWRADAPASFTLHHGDFGFQGVTVLVLNLGFSTDSALEFAVERPPETGTVQVVNERHGHVELVHEAATLAAAEAWAARNYYSNARIVVVGETGEAALPHAGP
jgi:hypothetical protein